ncbi:MAG: hypothetical protein ABIR70_10560 [Bryobacteraceae bacterium]
MAIPDKDFDKKEPAGGSRPEGESEDPLENQPLDWSEEDIELERRKPDLAEIEEDEASL